MQGAATVATEEVFEGLLSDTCYWLTVQARGNGTTHRDALGPQAIKRWCPKETKPNRPPTVEIHASSQMVDGGEVVSLDASASDPDGDTLTYSWSGAGGFANSAALDTTWTAPAAQATDRSYTLTITVWDGKLSAEATVTFTVRKNRPPTVGIHTSSQTVDGGETISVDASASDPDGDTLTYSWSGAGTFANSAALDTSWTAPAAQASDQSYTLTITVRDGKLSASASVTFTVRKRATPVPPPGPQKATVSVTHDAPNGSVTEGTAFNFWAEVQGAVPAGGFTAELWLVNDGGDVVAFATTGKFTATFQASGDRVQLPIETLSDTDDEEDGTLRMTVLPGEGYEVSATGNESTVTVKDDDAPGQLFGIRVNGNLTGGKVTVRWDELPRAGDRLQLHHLRFAPCGLNSQTGCNPTADEDWEIRLGVSTGTQATLGELQPGMLYKVSVMLQIGALLRAEETPWSDFAVVYPSTMPPTGFVDSITKVWGHIDGGHFSYRVCSPSANPSDPKGPYPIPSPFNFEDIERYVRSIEKSTKWRKDDRLNIVRTNVREETDISNCVDSANKPYPKTMLFTSLDQYKTLCGEDEDERGGGCFVISGQFIVLPIVHERPDITWTGAAGGSGRCTTLQPAVTHEVMHAFGFLHYPQFKQSLTNAWRFRDRTLCVPTKYDVVALMANYQSR